MENILEQVFGKKTPEEIEIQNQIDAIIKEREEANENEKWEKRLNPLYEKLTSLYRERSRNRARLRMKPENKEVLTEEEIVARIKERAKKRKESISDNIGTLLEAYKALPRDEKRIFVREVFEDVRPDGAEPKFTKRLSRDETGKFLEYLVQCVIDYIIYEGIEGVDEVSFRADGLKHSIEEGKWVVSTDGFLQVFGSEPFEDDDLIFQRVNLGECY